MNHWAFLPQSLYVSAEGLSIIAALVVAIDTNEGWISR